MYVACSDVSWLEPWCKTAKLNIMWGHWYEIRHIAHSVIIKITGADLNGVYDNTYGAFRLLRNEVCCMPLALKSELQRGDIDEMRLALMVDWKIYRIDNRGNIVDKAIPIRPYLLKALKI